MMICPPLPPVPSPEPSWTGMPSAEVPPPGPPAAPSPTTVSGSVSPGGRVGRGRPGSGTCAGRSGGVGRVAGSFSGSSDVPPPDGEPSAGVSPSEGSPSEGVPVEGPSVAGVPVGVPSGVVPPVAPSSAPPGAVGDPGAAPSSVAPPPGACVADGAPVSWPAPIGARPVGESGRAGPSSAVPLAVVVVPAWSSSTAGTCTGAVVPSDVAGVAPAVPVPPELDGDPVVAASSCARPAAVPSPSSGSFSSVQVAAVPSTGPLTLEGSSSTMPPTTTAAMAPAVASAPAWAETADRRAPGPPPPAPTGSRARSAVRGAGAPSAAGPTAATSEVRCSSSSGEPSTTGSSTERICTARPRSSSRAAAQRGQAARCRSTPAARAGVRRPRSRSSRSRAVLRQSGDASAVSRWASSQAARSPSRARRESWEMAFGLRFSCVARARGVSPSTSVSHRIRCQVSGRRAKAVRTSWRFSSSSTPSEETRRPGAARSRSSTASSWARRPRSTASLRTTLMR